MYGINENCHKVDQVAASNGLQGLALQGSTVPQSSNCKRNAILVLSIAASVMGGVMLSRADFAKQENSCDNF